MFVTRRRIGRTGALLGTWCGATGPQEPAEPVEVDRGTNPVPESATAPAQQPPQGPAEFPGSGLPGVGSLSRKRVFLPECFLTPRVEPSVTLGGEELADGPHMALATDDQQAFV